MKSHMWLCVCAAVVGLLAGPLAPAASAQGAAELVGTWALDEARSDPGAMPAGRGGFGGGRGGALPPGQMLVTQSGQELTVQRGNQAFTYALDGSERPGPPGGETKSTLAVEGGKVVVTWKREYFAGAQAGYVTNTGRDVYTRSGTTLTVERTTTTPKGSTTVKAVYNKVS